MSMGITVEDFKYVRGVNDAEYIELLKNAYERQKYIASKAIAKLKEQPKIIRCKYCKEFRRWIDTDIEFCDRTENIVSENDFCSRAEKRTDGKKEVIINE